VSLLSVPSIISVAHTKQLLNQPNHRTIHLVQTPTLGGIAIFAGFASSLSIFGVFSGGIQHLFAGCLIMFLMGVKDDIVDISALKKLLIQVLPALLVVVIGNIRLTSLYGIFNIYEIPLVISYFISIFIIVGVTNAVNLIDGLDGLAGTIVSIISSVFGVLFFIEGDPFAFVAFALAGGTLGFLKYNFYRAKIFMGDSGSLLSGFIIAVMAIRFVEIKSVTNAPALAIGVLIIPIFDTIKVFTFRILKGKSPFDPDKNHIHHKLLELGLPQIAVVVVLASLNLFITAFMMINEKYGSSTLLFFTAIFLLIFGGLLDLKLVKHKVNVKENI
jgi:UDP-GlcNAc:undecaprenyl-phosphate/decaprenyl-phosphate GlcNAc-1-phosphate transferase